MIIPIFHGVVKDGKLTIMNRDKFDIYIAGLNGEVDIVIKKHRARRSDPQNRYYWLCLNVIGDCLGYTSEELHDTFKSMFLTDHTGAFPVVRSTTSLDKLQFGEYMEKIRVKAAELGIMLPIPEDAEN